MPIWSGDQTKAVATREDLGGNDVHFSIDPNPTGKYKDEKGNPIQHDRAFASELPGVQVEQFDGILKTAMAAAMKAAVDAKSQANAEAGTNDEHIAGSTGTILLYDPKSFTVHIASRGDSPAFLILDDGEKLAAVRLTSSEAIDNLVTNSLTHDPRIPTSAGHYEIGQGNFTGVIRLEDVIRNAIEEYELDGDKVKTHLLMASDGILKPYPSRGELTTVFEEQMTMKHYNSATHKYKRKSMSPNDNIANDITTWAIRGNSTDNITTIFVNDIQQGKGEPLVMAVADGFYKQGHKLADAAIKAVEQVVRKERVKTALADMRVEKKPGGYLIDLRDSAIRPEQKKERILALQGELEALDATHVADSRYQMARGMLVSLSPLPEAASLLEEASLASRER